MDKECTNEAKKAISSLKALGRGAIFQQDNEPKHSAKATSALLMKMRVKVLGLPSMSLDLHPIEHNWNHLQRQDKNRQPSNHHELKDAVVIQSGKISNQSPVAN